MHFSPSETQWARKRPTFAVTAGRTTDEANPGLTQASEPPAGVRGGDLDLARRAAAGDEAAFREIVERYQARVFSVAQSIIGNRGEAEDIAQEVFTKVYFGLSTFDCRAALATWIHRIAVNKSFDHLRRRKCRKLAYESDLNEGEGRQLETAPDSRLGDASPERRAELRQIVVKLLAELSPLERYLLIMKEVEGYRIHELAGMLAINENTLKVRILRARCKMAAGARKMGLLHIP